MFIDLFTLLAISICQIVLVIVYHGQCPASPFLSTVLIIEGTIAGILSITALLIHHFDSSNQWNLLLTYILFIHLIGSRISTSIMIFRLSSRLHDHYRFRIV
jgi:hypothetical protein